MTIGPTRFEPELALLRFAGGEPCIEEAGVLRKCSSNKSLSAIGDCSRFIVEDISEDVIRKLCALALERKRMEYDSL